MTTSPFKIPAIGRINLPSALPQPKALASFNENETTYHPDLWELEYVSHRYLGRIDEAALRTRYDGILRNMRAIISDDRNVIPIKTFLSSWYWFRKEHQTRLELALRSLPLHCPLPVFSKRDLSRAPARPRNPNALDVVFRYGDKRWLREMVDFGNVRVRAAEDYAKMENDPARFDNELTKERFSPGEYVTLTFEDGRTAKPIGDIKYSVSGTDYYLLCVSNDWDPDLFAEFGPACVVIHDPEEFARRLEAAGRAKLGNWYFHYNPVGYFDPYEPVRHEYLTNSMSKDFRYACQRETRFLFAGMGQKASGFIDLTLGPLSDIATYTEL